MASLKVNLILWLLAEAAKNKARNVLITKYCGITYYEFVCVCVYACLTFPTCKAHVLYYTVICGLSATTIFSPLFHKQHDFRKEDFEHKMCFVFPYNFCPKYFSF